MINPVRQARPAHNRVGGNFHLPALTPTELIAEKYQRIRPAPDYRLPGLPRTIGEDQVQDLARRREKSGQSG